MNSVASWQAVEFLEGVSTIITINVALDGASVVDVGEKFAFLGLYICW